MTHKAKMPEPTGFIKPSSTVFIKSLSDHGRLHTEIKRCGDDEFTAPIYTTTQAEAYADAVRREALEEAAQEVELCYSNNDSQDDFQHRSAAAIRALIPHNDNEQGN